MAHYRVGLIGYPVEHSLSPVMHNAAFAALGMTDWQYDAMSIPPDILRLGLREPRNHGYIGINVTVPHKEAVMQYVRADAKARAIGAVNTVDFRDNRATNTDADGFIADLHAHDVALPGQRVLVLGAGGAARAAVYGLLQAGAQVAIVNRSAERAHRLVQQLRLHTPLAGARVLGWQDALDWDFSLLVNCTSLGMHPRIAGNPWPQDRPFPPRVTVYDMVYNPALTALMQQCRAAGGRAIGGLGMLLRQGAIAFELWTGVAPPIHVMRQALEMLNKD